jgi:DmsE family decaheme c-type cytochrome
MHISKLKRFALLLAIAITVALVCSLPVFASKDQQAQSMMPAGTQPTAKYVGADTCKACHEDIVNQFQANPHWDAKLKVNGTEVTACETCHGPGQAHVESGGDKSKIFSFTAQSPEVISGRCLTCHAASHPQGNFMRSMHFKNGVSCIQCHSPHHAREKNALLLQDQPTLCYRCHADVRAAFAMPYRHRVDSKLIQCSDCHNPHGSYLPGKMLHTTEGQEMVCFKCHRDKQGPFLYEHLPVKTAFNASTGAGCTACHVPHGSTNPKLLRVWPVNILCLQCHTQVMVSATVTANGVPPIPTFHNQAQKYQACTLCHTNIHGSNASDFFFY